MMSVCWACGGSGIIVITESTWGWVTCPCVRCQGTGIEPLVASTALPVVGRWPLTTEGAP